MLPLEFVSTSKAWFDYLKSASRTKHRPSGSGADYQACTELGFWQIKKIPAHDH